MRSRYSAFVKELPDYLLETWAEETRPSDLTLSPTKWLGLKIKSCRLGRDTDNEGWVEFVARYKEAGKAERIEELSYFKKVDGRWLYVAAD